MARYSVESMAACGCFAGAVVVLPEGYEAQGRELFSGLEDRLPALAVVTGGASRQESVRLGLDAVPGWAGIVVCHDAARPFAPPALFGRVLGTAASAKGVAGAVPVVASPDTVKRVLRGRVVETLPREQIGLAQTPQAFLAKPLRDAHRSAAASRERATDDAMLLESAGFAVVAVEGDPSNFKITSPADLERAELTFATTRLAEARGGTTR